MSTRKICQTTKDLLFKLRNTKNRKVQGKLLLPDTGFHKMEILVSFWEGDKLDCVAVFMITVAKVE